MKQASKRVKTRIYKCRKSNRLIGGMLASTEVRMGK